jgi:maltooligosyltrehalose trehalohydrolase
MKSTHRTHAMPFGAMLDANGVSFSLWAPTADAVKLVVDGRDVPMPAAGEGWRRVHVADVGAGALYRFRLSDGLMVPDPASRHQPEDVNGPSEVIDPAAYDWSDGGWTGRAWEETVLYEVHVGTATAEGTFAALEARLEDLRDLGVTAIELMPVAEFPGERNWGYDGVLPYAPDAAYGRPEDLKRLVDKAHRLGLMMFLDVVYNHFGPSGNYLHAYAGTFFTERHPTPWGAGINVDGADATPVREFFIHNALYWLEEFHFDGLRFDAVHAIKDDGPRHFLDELAFRVRDAFPGRHVHLVLENEFNEARWLARSPDGRPVLHTAQWADDVHNAWHPLLTGESEGYYEDFADAPLCHLGRALAEGFAYQGDPSRHQGGRPRGERSAHLPPSAFVAFLQNHDQVGNRAFGERLSLLVPPNRLATAWGVFLLSPQIPLLFQGEDWGSKDPFLFFVDFEREPDLAKAVRDGRRREFAHFAAFAEPGAELRIPDPTARDTFTRSKLDGSEAEREPHAAIREETRRLLAIRRTEIVPLLASGFRGGEFAVDEAGVLTVIWRFDAATLRLHFNAGETSHELDALAGRAIWTSAGVSLPHLPSWSACFTVEPVS